MVRMVLAMAIVWAGVGCAPAEDPLAEAASELKAGNVAKAVAWAEKATAAKPKDPAAWNLLGEALLAKKDYSKAVEAFSEVISLDKTMLLAVDKRGDAYLKSGKFKEAIADYDVVIKAKPVFGPEHWRRGIALYYAGKYAEGAKQFESHKTVNPNDVENAAWHFLCVARARNLEDAKEKLIDVTGDARVPMAEIQKLFAGKATVKDVLAKAGAVPAETAKGKEARFYAHLYLGLYAEANGDVTTAKEHLKTATQKYEISHYMWDIAAMHYKQFEKAEK